MFFVQTMEWPKIIYAGSRRSIFLTAWSVNRSARREDGLHQPQQRRAQWITSTTPTKRTTASSNKARSFKLVYERFQIMYFCNSPVYDEREFERRFQMLRRLFQQMHTALRGRGVFVHLRDATGCLGINSLSRIIAALLIIAYGMSFDQANELCKIDATNSEESFLAFIDKIIYCFSFEYLCCPKVADLKRILSINAVRWFPGCLGIWNF